MNKRHVTITPTKDLNVSLWAPLKDLAQDPIKFHSVTIKDGYNPDFIDIANFLLHLNPNYEFFNESGNLEAVVNHSKTWGEHRFNTTDQIVREFSNSKYFINIGCNDGISFNDCCYPLYLCHYNGVAFDKSACSDFRVNYPDERVQLVEKLLKPEDIEETFMDLKVPKELALLKIDIDGYDGELMESILTNGYRPDFIDIEINPEFPPPVKFSVLSGSDKFGAGANGGLYGCSVAYIMDIAQQFGYSLCQLSFGEYSCIQDMVLMRDNIPLPKLNVEEAYAKLEVAPRHLNKSHINTAIWNKMTDYDELLIKISDDLDKVTDALPHSIVYHLSL